MAEILKIKEIDNIVGGTPTKKISVGFLLEISVLPNVSSMTMRQADDSENV